MDLEKRYSRLPDIEFESFRHMFDSICAEFDSLPAMRARLASGEPYTVWTYADLRRESYAVARFLAMRGLRPGERVAIISENRPEWCFSYIAAVVSALVVVPVDSSVDVAGLAGILESSRCRALFCSASQSVKVTEALAKAPSLAGAQAPVVIEFPDSGNGSTVTCAFAVGWPEAVASAPGTSPGAGLPTPDSISGDSPAVIIYTSGTTGVAKGIVLSHAGIIANINASIQSLNVRSDDVFIEVLPLHHTYAATCTFLSPLAVGGSLTFVEKIVPTVILKHVKESRVTYIIGVPLLFDKIKQGIRAEIDKLKGPAAFLVKALFACSSFMSRVFRVPAGRLLLGFLRAKAGLGSVKLGVAGGGPLAWDTAEFFETLGLNLVQGYGMSENGPLIAVNLPEYKNNRSVGLPVKRTRIRIADPGADGVGEIQVKSPSLMLGYLDQPEATAAVLSDDAWLRTGDLGYIDARGFIFITGRSKNLIVTEGGKNVYPEEIELKFEGSAWVREVLILGRRVSGNTAGERIVAVCVPDWDRVEASRGNQPRLEFAEERVRDEVRRVNKSLPSFMKIVDTIVRQDEFEKTSTRKIRRFLYSDYANQHPGVPERP